MTNHGKAFLCCILLVLLTACGKEERIYGISFTNDVYTNPNLPPQTHHVEESYRDLESMGINTVRFYLNYGLFEDDKLPYEYKESGFRWVEQNIKWAKKYHIRLILNVHYPQGGYQSGGQGNALWTEEENQKRFVALWGELAKRYAKEKTIVGYGILNEPMVPAKDSFEESIAQWEELAQKAADAIRKEDDKHCIYVERLQGITGLENAAWEYDYRDERNFIDIDDNHYSYEFHYYNPINLTHQGIPWYEQQKKSAEIPSDWETQLKQELELYLSIGKKRGIPMYLGETGTSIYSMQNNREGEKWLKTILEIANKKELGITFHCYHEPEGFGLYIDGPEDLPKTRNEKMLEIIKRN